MYANSNQTKYTLM